MDQIQSKYGGRIPEDDARRNRKHNNTWRYMVQHTMMYPAMTTVTLCQSMKTLTKTQEENFSIENYIHTK